LTEPTIDPTDAPGTVSTNSLSDAAPVPSDPTVPRTAVAPDMDAPEMLSPGLPAPGLNAPVAAGTAPAAVSDEAADTAPTPPEAPAIEAAEPQAEPAPIEAQSAAPAEPASSDIVASEPAPSEMIPVEPERPVFADLGLSDAILRAIEEMGYRHPTPIQAQAIPVVLAGRDVMGVAQTGTGKTAGFTLPMLDILTGSRARARMPRSLILEPTRELALQVAENFVQYGKYLKLTHALIIGGESMSDQKDILMKGVDVLIATPGRLIDMFDRGSILLSDAKLLVIDEADRMLDMGFIPDVERIVSLLPASRQTLFFSATMGPEIRRLADAFLREPKQITVSRPASVATTITEGLVLVAELDKREALRRLIRAHKVQNALIFCNRKVDVDILYKSLNRHRFSVGALHGDMAQSVRFQTLEKFKAGDLQLLVCSDVAARGIDIGGLSHVFNFDVPHHAEDYVHRIGRTGRAGLEGHAYTIAKPDDRLAIEAIEKLTGHAIPPIGIEGLDPVDWAEGDGRRRRGRGAKKSAEPKRTADPKKAAPSDKPARDRPRRMRSEGAEALPVAETSLAEELESAAAPGLDMPKRAPRRRSRSREAPELDTAARDVDSQDQTDRDAIAPDDPSVDEPSRDDIRSAEARHGEPRRDNRGRDEPGRDAARRDQPRRDGAKRGEPRRDEPARKEARRDESRRDEPRRDEARRDEARRDEPRRDEPRRDEPRRDDPRRDDWNRDAQRRGRFRRDDDLGPPVLGFGDDIPAFMSLRVRIPSQTETTDTEA